MHARSRCKSRPTCLVKRTADYTHNRYEMASNVNAQKWALDHIEWTYTFLGLTWVEIGAVVGTSTRTVHRWRKNHVQPGRDAHQVIEKIAELRFWLHSVFQADLHAAREWLRTPLVDLEGETPIEVIKAGKMKKISEYLSTFHTGAFI